MKAKALEIRDRGTFIPALAVDMNPSNGAQRYLLRRCGYACDDAPNVILARGARGLRHTIGSLTIGASWKTATW